MSGENQENQLDFIPQICKIKHEILDKEIENIKQDGETRHVEIKDLIKKIGLEAKENHKNLKNKIILSEKSTGDKIDALNSFDDTLKGNGNPGVWETIRNIKRNGKITMAVVFVIVLLMLGGEFKGISLDKFKEKIKPLSITKQVEEIETKPVEFAPIEKIKPEPVKSEPVEVKKENPKSNLVPNKEKQGK